MTEGTIAGELSRLDGVIADNDLRDTPNARWRAATAVYEKAEIIKRLHGDDAALALYADVIHRLDGGRQPGPRAWLICAMNAVAVIHHKQGRDALSMAAAEAVVREHFEDAPSDATEAVVNATLLLAQLCGEVGAHERALELLEQLIERYGRPGSPDHRRTAAVANTKAATALGQLGKAEQGMSRFKSVIRELGDPVEPELRRALLDALVHEGNLLIDMDLPAHLHSVCKEIVERFAATNDPEIAENVAWARKILDDHSARARRRGLKWRR